MASANYRVGDLVKYCFDHHDLFVITEAELSPPSHIGVFTLYSTKTNKIKHTRAKFWYEHLKVVSHASR